MRVDETKKVIHISDNVGLQELAEFLNKYPEGEYTILIHEFDEDRNIEW